MNWEKYFDDLFAPLEAALRTVDAATAMTRETAAWVRARADAMERGTGKP